MDSEKLKEHGYSISMPEDDEKASDSIVTAILPVMKGKTINQIEAALSYCLILAKNSLRVTS